MPTFREYPGALDRFFKSEKFMQAVERFAKPVLDEADRISPVDTGQYRDEAVPGPGGNQMVRTFKYGRYIVRVINPTPYAKHLEHGTRYMRAQRILGRAMDARR